jgi:hypothetical protein
MRVASRICYDCGHGKHWSDGVELVCGPAQEAVASEHWERQKKAGGTPLSMRVLSERPGVAVGLEDRTESLQMPGLVSLYMLSRSALANNIAGKELTMIV